MKKLNILLLLIFPFLLQAQQVITLRSAIDSALKNNFDIRIARNNLEINNIYNKFGEAGGLPDININGSGNDAVNNTFQRTNTGVETTKTNVPSSSVLAGVNANLTLFNGFKVIATKERLNLLEEQSQTFLNQQVQNTIAAVMIKYYDIIRQESYMQIVVRSLDIARKKLDIINQRRTVGLANDADVLQAQIDLNMIDQSIKNQELIINQAKTDLLNLLSVKHFFPYDIKDTILVNNSLSLDSTLNFLHRNPQYLSQEQQIRINEQIVKEISAERYPSIRINTGYNYSLYNNSASQVNISQSMGPTLGVTLQIPIFNGLTNRNHREAAKYNVVNAKLEQESIMNNLTANALKTYQSYSNTLGQLSDQQNNYSLSAKLLSLMINRFQLNQATILDMKAAQESFENAGYLLVNLQFAAKVSEIELKLLTYSLGKSGDF